MPIYNILGVAGLYTEIQPEGYLESDSIPDLENESSWSYRELEYDVEVRFQVEADDEDSARDQAYDLMRTIRLVGDPLDWTLGDPEIQEVELVQEPLTLDSALQLIADWLRNHDGAVDRNLGVVLTPEIWRAIDFLVAYQRAQETRRDLEPVAPMPIGTPIGISPTQ